MDRRVTPPKRVTSPTWLPHLHVNRSLIRTFPQLFSSYLFATHVNFLTFDKYDIKSSKILFFMSISKSIPFVFVIRWKDEDEISQKNEAN